MMDYFDTYFKYAGLGVSEPPAIFHRWTALSIVGALLGRQVWLPFGHSKIYPNQYIMIMGSAGCRKSTAINIGIKLLKASGYTRFASDRTSKEKFLMDMQQYDDKIELEDLEMLTLDEPAECYIAAEEFTDFIGHNNVEFLTMLTKLWDNPPEYKHPKIHGQSVVVTKPTVNILSGNTPQNFVLAFPAEALGTGFLSRMILVHGDPTGRKVTFPPAPDEVIKARLISHLKDISMQCHGAFTLGPHVSNLCDTIYQSFVPIDDHRFTAYSTRRFTHLLKIAGIIATTRLATELSTQDIIQANTLLYATETHMPKALGEFGKSKFSDVSQSILDMLEQATKPLTMQALWKRVAKDLTKMSELIEVVKNLQHAERIQSIKGGFLPMKKITVVWDEKLLDMDWLTEEEKI